MDGSPVQGLGDRPIKREPPSDTNSSGSGYLYRRSLPVDLPTSPTGLAILQSAYQHTRTQENLAPSRSLPPIEIMDFGGPTYDPTSHSWLRSYMVLDDGSIVGTKKENAIFALGDYKHDGGRQVLKALGTITPAAGKIYITICRCRHPSRRAPPSHNDVLLSHDNDCHDGVECSGFWLEGYKFVTAAHFLNLNKSLSPEEKKDTIDFLKYISPAPQLPSPSAMRARVSCELHSDDKHDYETMRISEHEPAIHDVRLVELDEFADIAIFKPALHETRRPKTWIKNSQLSSAAADNPSTIDCKVFDKSFSAYYSCGDSRVDDMNDLLRLQRAKQENCVTKFEMMVKERLRVGQEADDDCNKIQPPIFEEVFHPNIRSIAFGHLAGLGGWNAPDQHAATVLRYHNIPGFAGCSGGMVGYLEIRQNPTPEGLVLPEVVVRIVGIFKGEKGSANTLVAFTQRGVYGIIKC
ncbi:hypothetical protein CLAIMM_05781 isoform 2 [Cladophialophora immunda]|nr:hypothetical protein CLAIMM_05781 isoform 2 [Cladophialophora immunda]